MRDLDGRYMLVNREYERLFAVSRDTIVGLTDHDLFPARIADEFRANDLQAAQRGRPVQIRGGRARRRRPAHVRDGQVPADRRRRRGVRGLRHLHRHHRTQAGRGAGAAAQRRTGGPGPCTAPRSCTASNRELDAFAYSVSHDLRAPLRSLDGFSQLLLEDYGDRLDDRGPRTTCERMQANAAADGRADRRPAATCPA